MTQYLTPMELRKRKELDKKPKEKAYRTTWELSYDLLCKLAEIDEDAAKGGRWAPLLRKQCKEICDELDARDKQ